MSRVFKLLSVGASVMSLWWYAHSLSLQDHHKQHSSDHHDQQHQHHHRDQDRHNHPHSQEQQQQNHQHSHEHSNGVDGHSHEPVEKRSRWMKTASQALMGWQSFNSDNSAQTSASSASLEMLLNERQSDPEQMLLSLGFGGESPSYVPSLARVPVRFLQQPSMAHGISIPGVGEEEDDDNYDDDGEEEEEDDNRGTPREESCTVERRQSGGRRTPGRTGRRKPGGFFLGGVLYWSRCGYLGVWALLQRGVPLYFFNEEGSHCYNSRTGGTGENRRRRRRGRRMWSQSGQMEGDARGEEQEWKDGGGKIFDVGDGGMGWSGEIERENGEEWSGVCSGEAGSQPSSVGVQGGGPVCSTLKNDIIYSSDTTATLPCTETREALVHSEHEQDINGNDPPEILTPPFHTLPHSGSIGSSSVSSAATPFAQTSTESISEPKNIIQDPAPHRSDARTNPPQIQSCAPANTRQRDSVRKFGKEGGDVVNPASRSEIQLEGRFGIKDLKRLSPKEDEVMPDLSARHPASVVSGSDLNGQTRKTDRSSVERKSQRKQEYDIKLLTSAMQEQVSRVKNVAKNFMSRFHAADDTDPHRTGQKRLEAGQKRQGSSMGSSTDHSGQGGSNLSLSPGQKGHRSSSNSGSGSLDQKSSVNTSLGQKDQTSSPSAESGQRGQGSRQNNGSSGGAVFHGVSREKGGNFEKDPATEKRPQNTKRAQEVADEHGASTEKVLASSSSCNSAQSLGAGQENTHGLDRGDNPCAVTYVSNVVSLASSRGGGGDGEAKLVSGTGGEIKGVDLSGEQEEETARSALPCLSGHEGARLVHGSEGWPENDDLEWCYDGESLDLNQVVVKPVSKLSSMAVGSLGSVGSVGSVSRTSDPVTVQTGGRGPTLVSSRQGLGPKGTDQSRRPGRTFDQISEPKQVQQRVKSVCTHVPGDCASAVPADGARKTVNFAESNSEPIKVTATTAFHTFGAGRGDVAGKVGHVISFTVPDPRSKTPLSGVSTGVTKQVRLGEEIVLRRCGDGNDGRADGREQERESGHNRGGGGDVPPPTNTGQAVSSSLKNEARSFLSSVLASRQAAELSGNRSVPLTQSPCPHPQRPPPYTLSPHKPTPHTSSPRTHPPQTQQTSVYPTQSLIVQLTSPLKRFSLDSHLVHSPLQIDSCAKIQGPVPDLKGQGREQSLQGEVHVPERSRKCRGSQSVRVPNHPRIPAAVIRRRISTGSVGRCPPSSTSTPAISSSSSSASFFSVRMTSRSADEFTRLTAKDFEEPDLTNVSSSSEEEEEAEGEEGERKRRNSVRFSLSKGESLV